MTMPIHYHQQHNPKKHPQIVIQMIWRLHKRGLGIKAIRTYIQRHLPIRPVPSENMISKLVNKHTWRDLTKRLDDEGNLR